VALAPLEAIASESAGLISRHIRLQHEDGPVVWLPRYLLIGPRGGDNPIRIGIFAGVHGDETEGLHALIELLTRLEKEPDLARGYCLFVYPICNPTGFEDGTRHTRSGHDLNREFWNHTRQPEVIALESELVLHAFDGIISLHSDNAGEGIYAHTRGTTIAESLLEPALKAAGEFLPRDPRKLIDGFEARDGIIRDGFQGVISPPPGLHPRPFEIVFSTPRRALPSRQRAATTALLLSILEEYRKFVSYMRHL
jgi:protein MpaA